MIDNECFFFLVNLDQYEEKKMIEFVLDLIFFKK